MKKRVIVSTIVSFVLLLAVIAAGINAVFTVTDMRVDFCVYSDDGRTEAAELKEKLDAYVGKSSTFLDLTAVERTVEEYPNFRAERVEKIYPSVVSLAVSERKETYAVSLESGYAILDERGNYLYDKAENVCRLGGKNILLEGFRFTFSVRERAEGDYAEELFTTFSVFADALQEVRANVVRARVERLGSESSTRNHFFYLYMSEGVAIRIKNPAELTREKAEAAVSEYLNLTDVQRVGGAIDVVDAAVGNGVYVSYSPVAE